MDKEKLSELVSAHLDGELTEGERKELDNALSESEEARQILASYQAQREAFEALPALKTPEFLQESTKARLQSDSGKGETSRSKSKSWVWVLGSLAACLAFFFIGEFVQPSAVERRLYLSPKGLVLSPLLQSEVIELSPGSENVYALTSPVFRGQIKPGVATIHWAADAGTEAGAQVKARLSLDVDGDSQYDVVHESDVVSLDSDVGFEVLSSDFVLDESELAEGPYKIRLELLAESETTEGLWVEMQPQHSHLTLPVVGFEPV